jgi:protein-S-isoprenylcysteine O-methyltransferase Ste14
MITAYNYCLGLMIASAAIVFILLFFMDAPYGKFQRQGWGPTLPAKWAWMIMELPSPALMILLFIISPQINISRIIFLSLWLLHYLPRTFIYPFRQSGGSKPFPLVVAMMAFAFNCLNGFVNGHAVFHLLDYPAAWLSSWPFIAGTILFAAGLIINKTADEKLRGLRRENPTEYQVPRGWLFEYISCPHYLGEIIEWLGWAVLTWSAAGLAFSAFTFANLFPRAIRSHAWYRAKFPDYPRRRKAIIPFIV